MVAASNDIEIPLETKGALWAFWDAPLGVDRTTVLVVVVGEKLAEICTQMILYLYILNNKF